jgi:hypothetical protein
MLALGHHFVNRSFSQQPATAITIWNISVGQQWVQTFGNIFSALTHLLLPISVSDASTQFFWRQVRKLPANSDANHVSKNFLNPWSPDNPCRLAIKFISTLAFLIPVFANPSLTVDVWPVAHSCNI